MRQAIACMNRLFWTRLDEKNEKLICPERIKWHWQFLWQKSNINNYSSCQSMDITEQDTCVLRQVCENWACRCSFLNFVFNWNAFSGWKLCKTNWKFECYFKFWYMCATHITILTILIFRTLFNMFCSGFRCGKD